MLANIVLLLVKPEIDPAKDYRGLVHANPSLLIDSVAHPILGTLIGSFDLFALYGLYLAALGMRRVARLSPGSAWSVVLAVWVLAILIKITAAAITKTLMA